MKRTKTIWLLHIWFIWAIYKNLEYLYIYQNTGDYFAYNNLGLAPLFFVLAIIVLALNIVALYYLVKPKKVGLKFAYFALIAAWLYNLITASLGLFNLEGMKQAFIKHKGPFEDMEAINVIYSPSGFAVMMFLSLLYYTFIAYHINKNKKHYQLNV